jgi:hypothetical protein
LVSASNRSIFCGAFSSETSNASWVRSGTGRPLASITLARIVTKSVVVRSTRELCCCGFASRGANAQAATIPATTAARAAWIRFI